MSAADGRGDWEEPDRNGCSLRYFQRFEPVAMAGYSIYIYHITLDEANRVRRELGLPELAEEGGESVSGRGTVPFSLRENRDNPL